jgi:hypothetical protein
VLEAWFFSGPMTFVQVTSATVVIYNANLKGAENITTEELEKQTKSLKGATMPDGKIHP